MNHENGIETAKVFLSETLFRRAYRAAEEENERELKRILTGQYRKRVKPDPMDIISIEWGKAPPKLRRAAAHDISVVATIEIARGHRVLANFVTRHSERCGTPDVDDPEWLGVPLRAGQDGGEIGVHCSCGESTRLSRESLRQHSWEDE